jgi:hypothetical protein
METGEITRVIMKFSTLTTAEDLTRRWHLLSFLH